MIIKKVLWIVGWIIFFPIPLTILIYKSKLDKTIKLLILLILWSFTILYLVTPTEQKTDNNIENKTEIKDTNNDKENNKKEEHKEEKEQNKEEKTKTYNISSEEYANFVYSLFIDNMKINDVFVRYHMKKYGGSYLVIDLYPGKFIEEDNFNSTVNKITENVFYELKKYNYKSGGFLKSNAEYINIQYHNYESNKSYNLDIEQFYQISILEIKNYKTYEDYLKSIKKRNFDI